jgi:hypothetical protein
LQQCDLARALTVNPFLSIGLAPLPINHRPRTKLLKRGTAGGGRETSSSTTTSSYLVRNICYYVTTADDQLPLTTLYISTIPYYSDVGLLSFFWRARTHPHTYAITSFYVDLLFRDCVLYIYSGFVSMYTKPHLLQLHHFLCISYSNYSDCRLTLE